MAALRIESEKLYFLKGLQREAPRLSYSDRLFSCLDKLLQGQTSFLSVIIDHYSLYCFVNVIVTFKFRLQS